MIPQDDWLLLTHKATTLEWVSRKDCETETYHIRWITKDELLSYGGKYVNVTLQQLNFLRLFEGLEPYGRYDNVGDAVIKDFMTYTNRYLGGKYDHLIPYVKDLFIECGRGSELEELNEL